MQMPEQENVERRPPHVGEDCSLKMLLGAQGKLDHPLEELVGRQADEIAQDELLGVEAHEVAQLQRSAPVDVMVSSSPTVQKLNRPIPNSPCSPAVPSAFRRRLIESQIWVAT